MMMKVAIFPFEDLGVVNTSSSLIEQVFPGFPQFDPATLAYWQHSEFLRPNGTPPTPNPGCLAKEVLSFGPAQQQIAGQGRHGGDHGRHRQGDKGIATPVACRAPRDQQGHQHCGEKRVGHHQVGFGRSYPGPAEDTEAPQAGKEKENCQLFYRYGSDQHNKGALMTGPIGRLIGEGRGQSGSQLQRHDKKKIAPGEMLRSTRLGVITKEQQEETNPKSLENLPTSSIPNPNRFPRSNKKEGVQ